MEVRSNESVSMKIDKTNRGFQTLICGTYPEEGEGAITWQSSAIGDYDNSFDLPGSSYLWFGGEKKFHLNREEVQELIDHLQRWVDTGNF